MRIPYQKILVYLLPILAIGTVVFFYISDHAVRHDPSDNSISSADVRSIASSTPESVVGQTFVVGIPETTVDKDTENFLREIKPGGIVLYKLNIDSIPQLTALISDLQRIALSSTGRKYLIMIDEEPGGATRLNLFQNVFATGQPDWAVIQNDISLMKQIGINVDLAPVADFPFDGDSFISRRMPAHTVADLVDFNKRFIALLEDNGVGATLKHFPGMGVFTNDPHAGITYSSASTSVVNESIDVFKQGVEDGADFVMTNHGVYDRLAPDIPASLSPKIVGMLRQKLGFKGIIITDDLSDMPFIINKNISVPEASLGTIEAGHTMLLFSRKKDTTMESWRYIVEKYQQDPEIKKVIDANYSLVVGYKNDHNL